MLASGLVLVLWVFRSSVSADLSGSSERVVAIGHLVGSASAGQ